MTFTSRFIVCKLILLMNYKHEINGENYLSQTKIFIQLKNAIQPNLPIRSPLLSSYLH